MLKKIIIATIALAAAGTAGYYLANLVYDKAVQLDTLPEKIMTFIDTNFPEEKIAFAKQDRDFLKMTYEVLLTDGTKLEFRRNGEWKEIDRHRAEIPSGIIPAQITAKINELYPDSFITKAERDDSEVETELDNGLELKFDSRGALIGIDR